MRLKARRVGGYAAWVHHVFTEDKYFGRHTNLILL
jgi:hypothetical protein